MRRALRRLHLDLKHRVVPVNTLAVGVDQRELRALPQLDAVARWKATAGAGSRRTSSNLRHPARRECRIAMPSLACSALMSAMGSTLACAGAEPKVRQAIRWREPCSSGRSAKTKRGDRADPAGRGRPTSGAAVARRSLVRRRRRADPNSAMPRSCGWEARIMVGSLQIWHSPWLPAPAPGGGPPAATMRPLART